MDDIELTAGLATLGEGLSLFIPTGTGDPFVSEMVSQGIEAGATFDLGWSSKHGVTLDGSVSLRVVIPIDKWLGPIHLLYLDIEMTFGDPSELSLAVAFAVEIGPITVTLDGIGLRLIGVVAADGDGHLGPFDLELAFKPPTGFGVVIDIADIVTGGGFLEFDPDHGEYSGVFAVQVLEGLGLTAVGMLTAPLPGQDDGWSLFFSITARFPFPIQLSFGFTLNAIGALVGIHRRMDVDAIGAGLADGSLDAIMFPDDPVANAPIILESLRTSFPEARGQYVFGAMVEIGWLPPLVSAQLGIIVQLPDPLQIVIVGQAECILPTKDAPLLELRTDVFGVIDLTAGTIAIDADLRDSRLVLLALTGSIAVRAAFLDDPSLLMAAGGFHPAFTAPPSFPSLERLGVALNVPDALDVRLEAYVAITSNTLQFGARFSFFGKAGPITAEGGAGFDALITFTPFGLTVGVDFGATIKVAGFDALGAPLSLQVSGPAPWRFVGTATFTLAGLEKDFHLDESIGRPAPAAPVPAVNVATLVCNALAQPDNWEILASADTGGVVLLAPVEPRTGARPGRWAAGASAGGPPGGGARPVRRGADQRAVDRPRVERPTRQRQGHVGHGHRLVRQRRLLGPRPHRTAQRALVRAPPSRVLADRDRVVGRRRHPLDADRPRHRPVGGRHVGSPTRTAPAGDPRHRHRQSLHQPCARHDAATDERVHVQRPDLRRRLVGDRPVGLDDIGDVRRDAEAHHVRVRRIARRPAERGVRMTFMRSPATQAVRGRSLAGARSLASWTRDAPMTALEVTFAPWAQRGLGAVADGTVDTNGAPRQHTTSVEAQLSVEQVHDPATVSFRLRGPGDVARARRRPDRAHRPRRRRCRERAEPVSARRVRQRPPAVVAHAGDHRW